MYIASEYEIETVCCSHSKKYKLKKMLFYNDSKFCENIIFKFFVIRGESQQHTTVSYIQYTCSVFCINIFNRSAVSNCQKTIAHNVQSTYYSI